MTDISANLEGVRARVKAAAERSGRRAEDVCLIAVTKLHEPEEMNEAIACGVTDIGENKVQELCSKYDRVAPGVRWHLIGHLQTNKVKYIVDKVCMIHSVDSLKLALEIDKRCKAAGRTMDILVEVNCGGEESKSGCEPAMAKSLVCDIINKCSSVFVKGLMTVAPAAEDPEDVRKYFRQLRELRDGINEELDEERKLVHLSMGMSHDFETAIEEGADMVRIGTAVFGARDYSK
ncbi:MAG: YggS family pyridoxal phosphate-dependent enzyme [Firmicutes bacterium]|nr:YggS family pyridoxal phosphate-dependent enzyme [Bacillota bacterium]